MSFKSLRYTAGISLLDFRNLGGTAVYSSLVGIFYRGFFHAQERIRKGDW